MSRGILNRAIVFMALVLCAGFNAGAQTFGSYTPYSFFGVGDLAPAGSAYNKTMGGVGIANRSNRYLNLANPASVTARDSLAFMADFSLYEDNKMFKQGNLTSVSNTFNINDLAMSFPIYRSSAFMVGLMPFSSVGYGYTYDYTDPSVLAQTGDISYSAFGQGSLYKAFVSAGVTFWKRLSLGAEMIYYFGEIEKNYNATFSDKSFNNVENGNNIFLHATGGRFGLQYQQPIATKGQLTLGATYSTKAQLKGNIESYSYAKGSAASDTLYFKNDILGVNANGHIAGEVGVGISYRHSNRWMLEFDYTRSDWSGSNIDHISGLAGNTTAATSGGKQFSSFTTTTAESYRVGFEITPNRNDIRYYFNRVSYRAGGYYRKEYYLYDGKPVYAAALTLGATLPIVNGFNGLTLGMEIGQRGSLKGQGILERFVNFSIGVNLFDIWFRKTQYQ